ncbi:MAG: hypothetical protein V7709_17675 [Halioglobus sp.]
MNWDAVGASAEMLAAIGVIITLLYLASQIRQNTESNRFSRYDSFVHSVSNIRQAIIENEDVASIFDRGLRDPAELSDLEKVRFRNILYSAIHAMETLHLQLSQSGLDKEIWQRQTSLVDRIIGSPGGKNWWLEHRVEFDKNFVQAVDKFLDRSTD